MHPASTPAGLTVAQAASRLHEFTVIGAGLVFSAATDTCGMAALLARLPHNRPPKDALSFEETLVRLAAPVL